MGLRITRKGGPVPPETGPWFYGEELRCSWCTARFAVEPGTPILNPYDAYVNGLPTVTVGETITTVDRIHSLYIVRCPYCDHVVRFADIRQGALWNRHWWTERGYDEDKQGRGSLLQAGPDNLTRE